MSQLASVETHCPYCGSGISIELEPDMAGQCFIEDCPVCCRPIELVQNEVGGSLEVRREDE